MNATLSIVLSALVQIESGARPDAVGDGGRAVGLLQIHPVMVAECNRIAGEERWTLADRWDPQASLAMARAFMARQMERGVTDPVELVCRWNRPDGSARAGYRARAEREVKRFSTREGGAR